MKLKCCVCERVHEDGEWVDKELDDGPDVSHGYCPPCLEEAKKDLQLGGFDVPTSMMDLVCPEPERRCPEEEEES